MHDCVHCGTDVKIEQHFMLECGFFTSERHQLFEFLTQQLAQYVSNSVSTDDQVHPFQFTACTVLEHTSLLIALDDTLARANVENSSSESDD
jgi:hypothetical protein